MIGACSGSWLVNSNFLGRHCAQAEVVNAHPVLLLPKLSGPVRGTTRACSDSSESMRVCLNARVQVLEGGVLRWVDLGFPGAEVRMLRIRGDPRHGAQALFCACPDCEAPLRRLRTVVVAAVPLTRCWC